MAILKSTNVNSGDPVTYDIINNIILDLNELNKATAAKFNLNLTQTGGKDGKDAVSQTIYSTTKLVKIKAKTAGGSGATWDFSKAGFTNPPRCWVQARSSASLKASQLNFTTIITNVSTTSMTFKVRGPGGTAQTDADIEFDCFAVEA
jgi:hypothetical protein